MSGNYYHQSPRLPANFSHTQFMSNNQHSVPQANFDLNWASILSRPHLQINCKEHDIRFSLLFKKAGLCERRRLFNRDFSDKKCLSGASVVDVYLELLCTWFYSEFSIKISDLILKQWFYFWSKDYLGIFTDNNKASWASNTVYIPYLKYGLDLSKDMNIKIVDTRMFNNLCFASVNK